MASSSLLDQPSAGGNCAPNGLHYAKRPRALEKTLERSEGTRPSKGENETSGCDIQARSTPASPSLQTTQCSEFIHRRLPAATAVGGCYAGASSGKGLGHSAMAVTWAASR